MSTRKKVYGFLILVALIVAAIPIASGSLDIGSAASAEDSKSADMEESEAQETAVPVQLAQATSGAISYYVTSTANLRPVREVEVVGRSDGIVEEILVEEGHSVEAGQLLARFDDAQHQIRLQTSRKKLYQALLQLEKADIRKEKAQTQISNTKEELARYQQLYREQLVSEREVAQIEYRLEEQQHDERISDSDTRELQHRVDELKAEIKQAELEIELTRIPAPFSGRITARMVETGQTRRNLDPLFKLADLTPLQADVFLSERESLLIQQSQSANITLGVDDSVNVRGRVIRISPVVDQATGTVKVTLEISRDHGAFKPGAFVRVDIRTDTRQQAVLVPKKALLEEDGISYLFVAENDSARRVAVDLGYQSDGNVEVLNGIEMGDQIVVAGQGTLKDNDKIKVIG